VLLAACIPARSGDVVLEFGCGAAAGLLCLATRIPGVFGTGIEVQHDLVEFARRNIAANDFSDRLNIIEGDVLTAETGPVVDHAFANPPWHDEFSTPSSQPDRDLARRTNGSLFDRWAKAMAKRLRHRGTLTFILAASNLQAGLTAMTMSGCGSLALFPLWAKSGAEARIILLQGIYRAKGPSRVLAGLVLHQSDGQFTEPAQNLLRLGAALNLSRN
jgi:tRNA1(Val) A37 N6-methylase TrmN6